MKKKNTNLTKMDMLVHLLVKVNNDDIFALASQLAYYLALSFFPFIIFLTNLISFTNIDSNAAINGLQSILPQFPSSCGGGVSRSDGVVVVRRFLFCHLNGCSSANNLIL